jgi:hypothetical protein
VKKNDRLFLKAVFSPKIITANERFESWKNSELFDLKGVKIKQVKRFEQSPQKVSKAVGSNIVISPLKSMETT